MVTEFQPVLALAGGALIGLSAVILMLFNGRIAGISGIVSRILPPTNGVELGPQAAFVLGLVVAPLLAKANGMAVEQTISDNLVLLGLAGFLVGLGSVLGSGCTSGHGVCGMSRFSVRSIAATMTFMATGMATVFVMRHVVGG